MLNWMFTKYSGVKGIRYISKYIKEVVTYLLLILCHEAWYVVPEYTLEWAGI